MTPAVLQITKCQKCSKIPVFSILSVFIFVTSLQSIRAVDSSTESPITSSPPAIDLQYSTENANLPNQNIDNNYEVIDVTAKLHGADDQANQRTGETTRIFTSDEVDDKFWLKHLGDDFKFAVHLQVGDNDQLTHALGNDSTYDSKDQSLANDKDVNDNLMGNLMHSNNLTNSENLEEKNSNKRSSFSVDKNLDYFGSLGNRTCQDNVGKCDTIARNRERQQQQEQDQNVNPDKSENPFEKVFVLDGAGFDLMRNLNKLKQRNNEMGSKRENYAKATNSNKMPNRLELPLSELNSQTKAMVSSPYAPIVVELPEDTKTIENTEDSETPVVVNMPPVIYHSNFNRKQKRPHIFSKSTKHRPSNMAENLNRQNLPMQYTNPPQYQQYYPHDTFQIPKPEAIQEKRIFKQQPQHPRPHLMNSQLASTHRQEQQQQRDNLPAYPLYQHQQDYSQSHQKQLPRPEIQHLHSYSHLHPHAIKPDSRHQGLNIQPNHEHISQQHQQQKNPLDRKHISQNQLHNLHNQLPNPHRPQYPPRHTQHINPIHTHDNQQREIHQSEFHQFHQQHRPHSLRHNPPTITQQQQKHYEQQQQQQQQQAQQQQQQQHRSHHLGHNSQHISQNQLSHHSHSLHHLQEKAQQNSQQHLQHNAKSIERLQHNTKHLELNPQHLQHLQHNSKQLLEHNLQQQQQQEQHNALKTQQHIPDIKQINSPQSSNYLNAQTFENGNPIAHPEILNDISGLPRPNEIAEEAFKDSPNKKPAGRFILRKPTIPYDSPSIFEIPLAGPYI